MYVRGKRTLMYDKAERENPGGLVRPYPAQTYGTATGAPTGIENVEELEPYYDVTYKSVLPEDQKALVERVKALAVKYGFELKVIDVTKKGLLQKLEDKLKGIDTFPTFITDSGLKIEGDITEERIKTLLH